MSAHPHQGAGEGAAWSPASTAPEGAPVETKIDDGDGWRNQTALVRKGRLWFFPDMSMYVYYTPTHWRPLPPDARGRGALTKPAHVAQIVNVQRK